MREGRPPPPDWLVAPLPWAFPVLVACQEEAQEAAVEVLVAGLGPLDSGSPDGPGGEPWALGVPGWGPGALGFPVGPAGGPWALGGPMVLE